MKLTPEEKANELINEYLVSIVGTKPMNEHTAPNDLEFAKDCALICVNQILDSGILIPQSKRHLLQKQQPTIDELEFWFQIKNHFKK